MNAETGMWKALVRFPKYHILFKHLIYYDPAKERNGQQGEH